MRQNSTILRLWSEPSSAVTRVAAGSEKMLFAVSFQDAPARLSVRAQFMSAHIEWLAKNADVVKVAGSLRAEADAAPEGALWIVEAETVEQVEMVVATDPFTLHGLRASWSIRYWSKAFPERLTPV